MQASSNGLYPSGRANRRRPVTYAVLATALFAAALGIFVWVMTWDGGTRYEVVGTPLLVAVVIAALGVVLSARAVRDAALDKRRGVLAASVGAVVLNWMMIGFGGLVVFFSTVQFTRGRQLRRFGRVLLPKVESGGAWAGHVAAPAFVDRVDEATKAAVAAQWRENGRTEHASVAAFARLTLDLMALGAPPELIVCANQDSLDEIRHAQMCFALARAIDGRIESPAPFAEAAHARTLPHTRTLALATLAVDSLVDGALHEGVSARIIAKLARRTEDPVVQAMLREIAADEGRHARHGWDVVRWCLAEGGEPVAAALEGAIARLPTAMHSEIPEAARAGAWESFGLMGEELERSEYEAGRRDLVTRGTALLAGFAFAAA